MNSPSLKLLLSGCLLVLASLLLLSWLAEKPARREVKAFEYMDAVVPHYPADLPWGKTAEPFQKIQLPVEPAESMKHMRVPSGFQVRLFAAEPDIVKPVAMAWDAGGRLWIAETLDYPNEKNPDGRGRDRIKICEDTDGDGAADRFTVFTEGLNIPTSLVMAGGGVIVSQAPDILFLKDTNGDDRADLREVLFSGFGTWDTHAGPSNLRWGFDNWIWGTVGYSGFQGRVGERKHEFRQGLFRFRPDGSELEFLGSTTNNTWGLGFSEEGFVFASTANNQHSIHLGIPNRYYESVYGWPAAQLPGIADHRKFHPLKKVVRQVDWHGGYTAAAGHALYTARQFPRGYWNRVALVAEPTGSLLHQCALMRKGSQFISRDWENLLASQDEWTSPIAAEVGPDGAVWVIDWYNYIIQHNPTPPGYQKGKGNAYEDPLRDKKHGRIYRILYKGSKPAQALNLQNARPEQLMEALASDNLLWRLTAQRLLCERGGKDVIPRLLEMVRDKRMDETGLSAGALHALWTLRGLSTLDGSNGAAFDTAVQALKHPSPGVRKAALQVLPGSEAALQAILDSRTLEDGDAHVRLAAALALSEMPPSAQAGQALARTLELAVNLDDRWLPDAITAGAARHARGFLQAALSELHLKISSGGETAAGIIRRVAGHYAHSRPPDHSLFLLSLLERADPLLAQAFLAGLEAGWPAGYTPSVSEMEKQQITALLERLPSELQEPMVLLADRWGRRDLFAAHVSGVVESLQEQVQDVSLAPGHRLEAARRLLRLLDPPDVLRRLGEEIKPEADPSLVKGLLSILADTASAEVGSLLVERWNFLPPGLRPFALASLMRRPSWTAALLEAVADGTIDRWELRPEQIQQLTSHPEPEIAKQARALAAGSLTPDRESVVRGLLHVAARRGDAEKGKKAFETHCARCHVYNGLGKRIGPDLTGIGKRSRADLLVEILDPSRSVEGDYRLWVVRTKDGRIFTGRLQGETQTAIQLLDDLGERQVLPREKIAQMRTSSLSLMPNGFEEHLSAEELAGLLEYLAETSGGVK